MVLRCMRYSKFEIWWFCHMDSMCDFLKKALTEAPMFSPNTAKGLINEWRWFSARITLERLCDPFFSCLLLSVTVGKLKKIVLWFLRNISMAQFDSM